MEPFLSPEEEQRLAEQFEAKRRILKLKGNYTHQQLEDAFHQRQTGQYLKDRIFGANDGIVTTFAVIAGAAGAGLSNTVIIVLGLANLIADGLSMGLGNYIGDRSDDAYNTGQQKKELWEVEHFPEIERAEVKGILAQRYGFTGDTLNKIMDHFQANPKVWVEFMMREELDIIESRGGRTAAAKHGLAMFLSFVVAGAIPLLPFLIPGLRASGFPIAMILAGISFFIIGAWRAKLSPTSWWKSGFEVLLIGGLASSASYSIGALLEKVVL